MGQIVIRNLDDAVLGALKRRAAAHRTSTEEEARRALAESVNLGLEAALARLDAARALNGVQPEGDSLELLRSDRARDGRA